MGRKNEMNNSTSQVDQYRKQLGRQEKKIVTERRKEMKRLKSEKETVQFWKKNLWILAGILCLAFATYVALMYYRAPKDSL